MDARYDTLKSKLQLENFSEKNVVSVYQVFYATVYLAGLAAACAEEADEQIIAMDRDKQLKYCRKSSQNRTIGKLRERFWVILLEPNEVTRPACWNVFAWTLPLVRNPYVRAVPLYINLLGTKDFISLEKPFCLKLTAVISNMLWALFIN